MYNDYLLGVNSCFSDFVYYSRSYSCDKNIFYRQFIDNFMCACKWTACSNVVLAVWDIFCTCAHTEGIACSVKIQYFMWSSLFKRHLYGTAGPVCARGEGKGWREGGKCPFVYILGELQWLG